MVTQAPQQRATQGFVGNLSWVRARPSLTAIEVAWRWVFGVPALLLMYREAVKVFAAVPWRATGIEDVTVNQLLTDPMKASTTIAAFAQVVGPGIYRSALWLAPLVLVVWAVVSGVGRTLLLKRMDRMLKPRAGTLMLLQLLRVIPLALSFGLWWLGVRALAEWAILKPIAAGGDPAMMAYVGGVIVLSLGLFVITAAVGWVFSLAPLLSAMKGEGTVASLRDSLRVGRMRGGLVEINMVLSIVKIALLVLALVFSACPLPFQTEITDEFLFWWNCVIAVWYFLTSDFFHVSRISSYLRLWQANSDAVSKEAVSSE
ncbi:hypothetical protein [Terriglobus roseus]|uniref:Uncharacterized protein n=1 Tax=Terriglobus roseus TaxID=392734 RepID=A0A1H4JJ00_9BACT|nr:hypothetical protein [Terriglobus roseus]SEB45638.1 hypothetical protein SAMN05443244_0616 [Terriglobus roseus]